MAGLKGRRADAILTHSTPDALRNMLLTLADLQDVHPAIKAEMKFAEELFNVNRLNRNFLVHSARAMELPKAAMLATRKTARGKIKMDHYAIAVDIIRNSADEQIEALEYYSTVIGPCTSFDGGSELRLPLRPQMPANLQLTLPTTTIEAIMFGSAS
jgi:hypothetical protein